MNLLGRDLGRAVVMGMILPALLLNFADLLLNRPVPQPVMETQPPTAFQQTAPVGMRLRSTGGQTQEMELEEYITGVLLAEVPAFFELEALKAQAVAARTYTRKALKTGGKHSDGSVCTSASCCQGYLTKEDYLLQGGTQEGIEKIQRAVAETAGQVLLYDGELIEATYFSCSGGSTEDAAAVWGTEVPYLQAVSSPGEEKAAYDTDTVVFTPRELQNALGTILPGEPAAWFGTVTYTEGGGVASMVIGSQAYSGTQLRSLLKLRSTNFTVEAGETIVITTRGYGHRVGMSQYGADAMAAAGHDFAQILAHYYPGTELTVIP